MKVAPAPSVLSIVVAGAGANPRKVLRDERGRTLDGIEPRLCPRLEPGADRCLNLRF